MLLGYVLVCACFGISVRGFCKSFACSSAELTLRTLFQHWMWYLKVYLLLLLVCTLNIFYFQKQPGSRQGLYVSIVHAQSVHVYDGVFATLYLFTGNLKKLTTA